MGLITDTILAPIKPYLMYAKIAAGVAVVVAVAGLVWYAHAEAAKVDALHTEMGVKDKTIADDKENLKSYVAANKAWSDKFDQMQHNLVAQSKARKNAEAQKDRIDAQLKNLLARLASDPSGTAQHLNDDIAHLVCMFNHESGGAIDCNAGPSAAPPHVAAPGPARP